MGNLIISKQISLGDFIAFNGYLGIIIRPVMSIGMIINFAQRAKASKERIEELLNEEPDIVDTVPDNPGPGQAEDSMAGSSSGTSPSPTTKKGQMCLKI